MVRVVLNRHTGINVTLKPRQGIKVGSSNKYLFDPTIVQAYDELAKDWATKTDGLVEDEDYSSKAYAIGGTGTETNNSKYYSVQSATSATNASISEANAAQYAAEAYRYRTTYIHEQGEARNQWVINHNLNKYPSVTVVDSANNEIIAEVKYESANTCIVNMSSAFKGKAFLN